MERRTDVKRDAGGFAGLQRDLGDEGGSVMRSRDDLDWRPSAPSAPASPILAGVLLSSAGARPVGQDPCGPPQSVQRPNDLPADDEEEPDVEYTTPARAAER